MSENLKGSPQEKRREKLNLAARKGGDLEKKKKKKKIAKKPPAVRFALNKEVEHHWARRDRRRWRTMVLSDRRLEAERRILPTDKVSKADRGFLKEQRKRTLSPSKKRARKGKNRLKVGWKKQKKNKAESSRELEVSPPRPAVTESLGGGSKCGQNQNRYFRQARGKER